MISTDINSIKDWTTAIDALSAVIDVLTKSDNDVIDNVSVTAMMIRSINVLLEERTAKQSATPTPVSKYPLVNDVLTKVGRTIDAKNHDYNGAFDKACDRIGMSYAAGKIFEKTERILTLLAEANAVEGEGPADALLDNIGYCTLTLARLLREK